jgi:hypothetical protein
VLKWDLFAITSVSPRTCTTPSDFLDHWSIDWWFRLNNRRGVPGFNRDRWSEYMWLVLVFNLPIRERTTPSNLDRPARDPSSPGVDPHPTVRTRRYSKWVLRRTPKDAELAQPQTTGTLRVKFGGPRAAILCPAAPSSKEKSDTSTLLPWTYGNARREALPLVQGLIPRVRTSQRFIDATDPVTTLSCRRVPSAYRRHGEGAEMGRVERRLLGRELEGWRESPRSARIYAWEGREITIPASADHGFRLVVGEYIAGCFHWTRPRSPRRSRSRQRWPTSQRRTRHRRAQRDPSSSCRVVEIRGGSIWPPVHTNQWKNKRAGWLWGCCVGPKAQWQANGPRKPAFGVQMGRGEGDSVQAWQPVSPFSFFCFYFFYFHFPFHLNLYFKFKLTLRFWIQNAQPIKTQHEMQIYLLICYLHNLMSSVEYAKRKKMNSRNPQTPSYKFIYLFFLPILGFTNPTPLNRNLVLEICKERDVESHRFWL